MRLNLIEKWTISWLEKKYRIQMRKTQSIYLTVYCHLWEKIENEIFFDISFSLYKASIIISHVLNHLLVLLNVDTTLLANSSVSLKITTGVSGFWLPRLVILTVFAFTENIVRIVALLTKSIIDILQGLGI